MTQLPNNQITQIRAAAVQMDVKLGENKANVARIVPKLEEAAANGAQLIVFPESAVSGYCFNSLDEAMPYAIESWNCDIWPFAKRCEELGVVGVLGFLMASGEPSEENGAVECYNSALLAGAGRPGSCIYSKTHLPILGVDRFV